MRVELTEISKSFGSVQALKNATLGVSSGEVVALVGDNGAGKSTLMKILAGALRPDGGTIKIDGAETTFANPAHARTLGIEMLYQDLALFDELNVTANVYLGREVVWAPWFFGGFLNFGDMRRKTKEIVDRFSIRQIGIHAEVGKLSGGQRQVTALARTVGFGSHIAILDEPTSALSPSAADEILEVVKNLARQDIGVVMISHNLAHVMEAAHRIVVLRLGEVVGNLDAKTCTSAEVVGLMVGSQPIRAGGAPAVVAPGV
jgi:ABC-type sugar transport system ATPase subunit